MNRFQLNFKRNVGPTSESIRQCEPKTLEEWREYYFLNVHSEDHIIDLGKKLYIKITEVICKPSASRVLQFLKGVFEHSKKFQKSWREVGFL